MKSQIQLSPEQKNAAEPTKNVVVQANAGTGKTFVLVQRLLRILFREFSSPTGASSEFRVQSYESRPFGILCLTYTNAGAAEMQSRILSAVMDWARASDEDLMAALTGISHNSPPTKADALKARQIFYYLIDNPHILKIQTIHSFCESVLRRFPIEAGVPPAWRLVSGAEQKRLLKDAFGHMLSSELSEAFDNILGAVSEHSLDDLLAALHNEYKRIILFKQNNINIHQIIDNTAKYLQVQKTQQPPDFYDNKEKYLTNDGEIRKQGTKSWTAEDLAAAEAIYDYSQYQNNLKIFENSRDFLTVCSAFADSYADLKNARNLLDFDDILHKTNVLFQNPRAMGMVLSSLDFNLKHILVDESQDNSPEMWSIIFAMLDDFFDIEGPSFTTTPPPCGTPLSLALKCPPGHFASPAKGTEAAPTPRSLFVVGDAKQSIFSFQGANPSEFNETPEKIEKLSVEKMRQFVSVELSESRRTTRAVLDVADFFFSNAGLAGMPEKIQHKCWRIDDAGLVQIIPKFLKDGDEKSDKTKNRYIRQIADKIESLINDGVPADDIMVLVQRRNPFAPMLTNELKRRKIQVAGADRVSLPEFSSVRDLLNMLRFAINPSDDASLAFVLRGPLFRWTEAQLMELCIGRDENKSLFERLKNMESLQ